jgi:NACalpha-BTF3-like transcription factor
VHESALSGDERKRKLDNPMDELVNLVVQRTGISQDDARKAVEVVVNALKSKQRRRLEHLQLPG